MMPGSSLAELLIVLAVLLLVLHLVARSAAAKGKIGENEVSKRLKALPGEYQVINNVVIPSQYGTAQIDHVVVSPYGIFVIETKNYSGWIFGAENSSKWKQTFKTKEGYYFRNPIKQNWGHIYALSDYLDVDRKCFKPIIVFSNRSQIHVESSTPVIHVRQLNTQILHYDQEIIPRADVGHIFDRLKNANLAGTDSEKRHTQTVRENLATQQEKIYNKVCPRCGGGLVLRNGRYGSFLGCSNYPQCRFTYKIR